MLRLDDKARWIAGVTRRPSPNQDARPADCSVDLVIVHGISLPPGEFGGDAIDALFLRRLQPQGHPYFSQIAHLRVAPHLLIRRDGELIQYAAFDRRAWHAGESEFCGRKACNDFSVGIELEGSDHVPYTDIQYQILNEVLVALRWRWPHLTPDRVVGHSDVAPQRKTDPGPAFDWSRISR